MTGQAAFLTATFYHFAPLAEPACWRQRLDDACRSRGIVGTILLAEEGINATICGAADAVREFLQMLGAEAPFTGLRHQESVSECLPLRRLKVKIRPEIVSLGAGHVPVPGHTGEHVAPADWNALISRAEVVLIDARNRYETAIGSFKGAIDPGTRHFSDLPDWLLSQARLADRPPVAMFCTGGIRCEKSTAWLKAHGFDEVYQLQGGILNYLREVPTEQSLWHGECFVFDERVSVNHALAPGSYSLCEGCGLPLMGDGECTGGCDAAG